MAASLQDRAGAGRGDALEGGDAMRRYSSVAMALHWVIAGLIFYQLGVGFFFLEGLASEDMAARSAAFARLQDHKAIGLTVLALSVLRVAWRFWRPAPAALPNTPFLQRVVVEAVQLSMYALMLLLPISGWAMTSASINYGALPTTWFDLFTVPHLPFLAALDVEAKQAAEAGAANAHGLLALAMTALALAHVGGALYHRLVLRDVVLARMTGGRGAPSGVTLAAPRAGSPLGALGGLAVLAAAGFGVWSLYAAEASMAPTAAAPTAAEPVTAAAARSAPRWSVVAAESALSFSGDYGMGAFTGRFEQWRAEIYFDPEQLAASRLRVEVDLASVATNDMQIDGALRGAEYFDVAAHPTAVFTADAIRAGEAAGAYVAEGVLSMRGASAPLALPFSLEIVDDRAVAVAELELARLDWTIGQAEGGMHGVGLGIPLSILVVARRDGGS